MNPLADRLRPTNFDEVYGQKHLIGSKGVLRAMITKKRPLSFILYGPPGCGKTTIAQIFANQCDLDTYFFSAANDNKAKLKSILDTTKYHNVLLIIDEIHRMKTDIQDYLLPFMESGKAVVIGLTTQNPYMSINIAIRSRCHIYAVKPLTDDDIKEALVKAIEKLDDTITYTDDALATIVRFSNHEVRSAYNILESLMLILDGQMLTSNMVLALMGRPQLNLDNKENHYFEILSALQKSIRGSDVDASIHYLARLLVLGDLDIILRRLMVIAYEDIGLANPTMGQKVYTACEIAKKLGFPEARIPLSVVVVEMALSPKSNTALAAIDLAMGDFEGGLCGPIPKHIDNKAIKQNPTLYKYPHDFPNSLNEQKHLPDNMLKTKYYQPKSETSYESALAERKKLIDKIKGY